MKMLAEVNPYSPSSVLFFTYALSQFLNRMNKMKGATSKPVLHSTLEVVQDLDDCLTEPSKYT